MNKRSGEALFFTLLLGLFCASPRAAAQEISVITSDSLLRMPEGSGTILLVFRNHAEFTWHDLTLSFAGAEPLTLEVRPPRMDFCGPSDRCVFAVAAEAKPEGMNRRLQLGVTLTSRERPALFALPLVADSTPGSRRPQDGTIQLELGTITVETTHPQKRTLALTLACIVPLLLLLGWALALKRRANRLATKGSSGDNLPPGDPTAPP